jgi:hypothetical protein
VHGHASYYLKPQSNICQHGFTKSKFTVTNLVTYFGFVTPLVSSQGQVDSINFDLSSALTLFRVTFLFYNLTVYELSAGYANWIHSYLTNKRSHVRFYGVRRRLLKYYPVSHKDLCWGHCYLYFLLKICIIILNFPTTFSFAGNKILGP